MLVKIEIGYIVVEEEEEEDSFLLLLQPSIHPIESVTTALSKSLMLYSLLGLLNVKCINITP
jgi:hypothetical protein